ncbi:MAG TPA: O-antigen ligase family protein [Geodermatophilus sp.]|nr:O-antigen ligase family protein [Geodermatophilus sp.]
MRHLPAPDRAGTALGLLAAATTVLEAGVDLLPPEPLVGWVTAERLVLAVGLVALLATGTGWRDLRTRLDVPVVLLVLAGTATTLLGQHPSPALRGLLTLVATYYLLVGVLRRDPGALRALAVVALAAVTVVAVTALGQLDDGLAPFGCRSLLLADAACGPASAPRTTGTFANPNLMAAFVLLVAPLAALAAGLLRDLGGRVVVGALVALGYLGLATSFSRAAVVAALLGPLALLLTGAAGRRLHRRWSVVAGALLALAGLVTVVVAASDAAGSVTVRTGAWWPALRVAGDSLLLGVGLGRAGDAITAAGGGDRFEHAHDLWLNWLVEAGVVGFLAVTLLTLGALVTAVAGARRGDAGARAGLVALVGLLGMSLADHPTANGRIGTVLWVVLAVVVATAPVHWRRAVRGRPPAPRRAPEDLPAGQVVGSVGPGAPG